MWYSWSVRKIPKEQMVSNLAVNQEPLGDGRFDSYTLHHAQFV